MSHRVNNVLVLAKEIQLQHKAPVLDIEVLDAKGSILTKDNEVENFEKSLFCSQTKVSISEYQCWGASSQSFDLLRRTGVIRKLSTQRKISFAFSSNCFPSRAWLPAENIR